MGCLQWGCPTRGTGQGLFLRVALAQVQIDLTPGLGRWASGHPPPDGVWCHRSAEQRQHTSPGSPWPGLTEVVRSLGPWLPCPPATPVSSTECSK